MVDSPSDRKRREGSQAEPEHRFVFGRRWEARRKSRGSRRGLLVLLLDVVMLLILVGMAWALFHRVF